MISQGENQKHDDHHRSPRRDHTLAYELPNLPYDYDALEPVIVEETDGP
jgi:hypothetical protein